MLGSSGTGGKGYAPRVPRLGRVLPGVAADPVELLGPLIPRLHLVIGDRPAGCRSAKMPDRSEVLGAVAEQHRAVELGVAADIVVVARVERLALGRHPALLGAEVAAAEDRRVVPRLGAVGEPLAPLEDHDPPPGGGERRRHGGAADAGADDDDVRAVAHHAIRISVLGSKATAFSMLIAKGKT